MATRPVCPRHLASILRSCRDLPEDAQLQRIDIHPNGSIDIQYNILQTGKYNGLMGKTAKITQISHDFKREEPTIL